jgi:hypothetical protein
MRIVTRADFDGVVCSVLLFEVEDISSPVLWVAPNDMQRGLVDIQPGDIIANLPYDRRCSLWFDHHFSNRIRHPFEGLFSLAPSAAGLVYKYYQGQFKQDFSELVSETDKIDSAGLSLDEILFPERFPYVLLSMTIQNHPKSEERYWNHLIDLLRKYRIDDVMTDPLVRERCDAEIEANKHYKTLLEKHTILQEHVAISDFRQFDRLPQGNRFLVYSMFPDAMVSVKIGYRDETKETMVVKVGHSILNKNCSINVGQMLSYFEGGGHPGAGSCRFHVSKADKYLNKIIDILIKNEAEGSIVEKKVRNEYDRRIIPDRRQAGAEEHLDRGDAERRKLKDQRVLPEPRKNWVGKPIVDAE